MNRKIALAILILAILLAATIYSVVRAATVPTTEGTYHLYLPLVLSANTPQPTATWWYRSTPRCMPGHESECPAPTLAP